MILSALLPGLLLPTSCISLRQMPPDQPCREAGFSIASRIFDCTGDEALANATYERFSDERTCILWDLDETSERYPFAIEADLFHCALAIDAMTCDEVERCGQDLDCYLSASPMCALVVEPVEAGDTGAAE